MLHKKISLSLAIVVITTAFCFGQGLKRKMADQYFVAMEYYKAAPIYDELATSSVDKNLNDDVLIRRAAVCCEAIHDYQRSEYWYNALVNLGKANDDDVLNFIRVLFYNKDYGRAKEFIGISGAKYSHYPIIEEYRHDLDIVRELMEDSVDATVTDVAVNSGLGEFSPTYYEDGILFVSKKRSLTIVNNKWGWDGNNFVNLFYAKKGRDGKISKSSKVFHKDFVSKFHNGPIAFNAKYDMAILTKNDLENKAKESLVRLMIFTCQKTSNNKWGEPIPFEYNSKDYSVGHPSLSADGKTLYFTSDMPGGFGETDIWMSQWNGSGWGKPENLGKTVNTPGREMFPFIHAHNCLYFASDGHAGLGGLDIFVAYDLDTTESYIENLGYPVNTNLDDFGLIVDNDGDQGFFSSNRIRSTKKKDQLPVDYIYEVKLAVPEFNLFGTVENNDNKVGIANAEVKILNNKTGEIVLLQSDAEGHFSHKLKLHSSYTISTQKADFESINTEIVSTEGIHTSKSFDVELKLSNMNVHFIGLVIDSKTKLPITNATFKIKEIGATEELSFTTDDKGQIKTSIKKNLDFEVHASAKEYLSGSDTVSTKYIMSSITIEKIIELTIFAKKGDVVKLEHIYYDYSKWDLRDEGKKELDKLADYLLENPTVKIELSSHTDSRGNAKDNQKLSQKRAQSCVDYLVSKGIPKDKVIAIGYGEAKLVNSCNDKATCTEEEHQLNRRTEVKILSN